MSTFPVVRPEYWTIVVRQLVNNNDKNRGTVARSWIISSSPPVEREEIVRRNDALTVLLHLTVTTRIIYILKLLDPYQIYNLHFPILFGWGMFPLMIFEKLGEVDDIYWVEPKSWSPRCWNHMKHGEFFQLWRWWRKTGIGILPKNGGAFRNCWNVGMVSTESKAFRFLELQ